MPAAQKKHFFFLTLKGHFKVKVKVKEIAHLSQLVKGYFVKIWLVYL